MADGDGQTVGVDTQLGKGLVAAAWAARQAGSLEVIMGLGANNNALHRNTATQIMARLKLARVGRITIFDFANRAKLDVAHIHEPGKRPVEIKVPVLVAPKRKHWRHPMDVVFDWLLFRRYYATQPHMKVGAMHMISHGDFNGIYAASLRGTISRDLNQFWPHAQAFRSQLTRLCLIQLWACNCYYLDTEQNNFNALLFAGIAHPVVDELMKAKEPHLHQLIDKLPPGPMRKRLAQNILRWALKHRMTFHRGFGSSQENFLGYTSFPVALSQLLERPVLASPYGVSSDFRPVPAWSSATQRAVADLRDRWHLKPFLHLKPGTTLPKEDKILRPNPREYAKTLPFFRKYLPVLRYAPWVHPIYRYPIDISRKNNVHYDYSAFTVYNWFRIKGTRIAALDAPGGSARPPVPTPLFVT